MRPTIEQLFAEWVNQRQAVLLAKRAMEAAGRCEYACRGYDDEDGVAPCYRAWQPGEECAACKRRAPLYEAVKAARIPERDAWRRLLREVNRGVPHAVAQPGEARQG